MNINNLPAGAVTLAQNSAAGQPAKPGAPQLPAPVALLGEALGAAFEQMQKFARAAVPGLMSSSTSSSAPFSADTAQKVSDKYKSDDIKPLHGGDARGGCMNAVYEGLGVLFSPGEAGALRKRVYRDSKALEDATNKRRAARGENPVSEGAFNSIDRVWETLQREGKAEKPMEFRHSGGKWSPSAESTVMDSIKDKPAGWYFFGVSASDGYHSVMLAADKTVDPPKLYWLDQFAEGFDKERSSSYATSTTDVTGKLDDTLANIGHAKTRVWPLISNAPQ